MRAPAETATVVIPTYNRAARLGALLECLTRQEGEALARVVVCDDGSSDDTEAVARSFEGRLPLVYAYQEDLGFRAGQARNMGIARAVGDIVVFVDDDVLVRPDFVAQHVRAHAAHEAERRVVIGYRHRTDHFAGVAPTWEEIVAAEREDRLLELSGPVSEQPTPWLYVYSCNFSVTLGHPELWFDESFSGWGLEDSELGYRLYHSGHAIIDAEAARVLHVEDPKPRDPFRCEARELPPSYDTYVRNAVYFMDKHPDDEELRAFVRQDLRWYVLDENGRWVKNGHANDVDFVIARCREQLRAPRTGGAASPTGPDTHAPTRNHG
jgi:glycosyltransferase involved in cell wall biosynthesis